MPKLEATHIADRLRQRSLCLNFMQQIEITSKARLCLSLTAPDDDTTLEEKQQHYKEQKERILSFVKVLNDTILCEHGKALLCL
jgi:hypothetical protein